VVTRLPRLAQMDSMLHKSGTSPADVCAAQPLLLSQQHVAGVPHTITGGTLLPYLLTLVCSEEQLNTTGGHVLCYTGPHEES
jgi:hypothetical protein